jgi:hypothetical protein
MAVQREQREQRKAAVVEQQIPHVPRLQQPLGEEALAHEARSQSAAEGNAVTGVKVAHVQRHRVLGRGLVALGAEGLGQVRIQRQADLGAIHRHQPVAHPACPGNLLSEMAHHLLLQLDQGLVGKTSDNLSTERSRHQNATYN